MKECAKCGICYSDDVDVCPQDQVKARHALPGGQLLAGRYFLTRRLGRGAMGQVYLAKDQNLGTREVAVKTVRQDILNSDDLAEGEAIARFEREAMSAASIRHPHIVDVTDFGESEDGVFYLVMEYVEGETLHRLLRREGTLPIKRATKILRQIADGVDAAHEEGILHRDLKPANIFIMQKKNNKDGFVKVGDFGLAKIVSQTVTDISSNATPSSRGIIGTPEYMSPEQMQPELGVDTRADLYALGTIAYLMLGGRTPFTGDMLELVMQKVVHDPPSLSDLRDDIPGDVVGVIMSALEREPQNRVATVAEWIENLEAAAEDVGEQKKVGTSKLTVLAPDGAEVYVDDERKGSIGRSGRLILTTVPAGQHILRVSRKGERDDERVIEIREGGEEQVIQAQLKPDRGTASQPSPSQGASSSGVASSLMPGIVACNQCGSKFAEGVQFCGRCGNRSFSLVSKGELGAAAGEMCPRCSAPLSNDSKFCGRCGLNTNRTASANLSSARGESTAASPAGNTPDKSYCVRCGSSYPSNVKFCGRCGTGIS
ncbi:MAG: protein kinase [Pyrinomonadaceae bacterium]|nr:protein kinase [Pyrinomonadaceae bacterium]